MSAYLPPSKHLLLPSQPPGRLLPPTSTTEDLSYLTYVGCPHPILSPKVLGTDGAGAGRGPMPAVATDHLRS